MRWQRSQRHPLAWLVDGDVAVAALKVVVSQRSVSVGPGSCVVVFLAPVLASLLPWSCFAWAVQSLLGGPSMYLLWNASGRERSKFTSHATAVMLHDAGLVRAAGVQCIRSCQC
jgi:hypothetical protein